jgi:hypothetical protein
LGGKDILETAGFRTDITLNKSLPVLQILHGISQSNIINHFGGIQLVSFLQIAS